VGDPGSQELNQRSSVFPEALSFLMGASDGIKRETPTVGPV